MLDDSIDATIACKVLSENISTIIESQIPLPSVVDYLMLERIISETEKRNIMDTKNTMNINERWRELLGIVQATIKLDEEVFLIFLNAIKYGGTRRETMLADKLHKVINMSYCMRHLIILIQIYKKAAKS